MQREGLPPVMVTIGVAFRADLRPPGSCEKNSPPANVMEKSSQEGILSAPPPYSLLSYVLSNKDIPRWRIQRQARGNNSTSDMETFSVFCQKCALFRRLFEGIFGLKSHRKYNSRKVQFLAPFLLRLLKVCGFSERRLVQARPESPKRV